MTKFLQEVRTMYEASWVVPRLTQTNPRWRRPPSLILEKNINISGLDKDICTKFHGKMHRGHAEIITWPKVETGSEFAWRHQVKVWSICASISVTITDISTKFGTEYKYHTINTPEWPNSHKLKIQDGGGRHLEFRKKCQLLWTG